MTRRRIFELTGTLRHQAEDEDRGPAQVAAWQALSAERDGRRQGGHLEKDRARQLPLGVDYDHPSHQWRSRRH
jgi:hypothetical protein